MPSASTSTGRRLPRGTAPSELVWHAWTFMGVNLALLLVDALGADGVTWAPWITTLWGFALAAHVVAYPSAGRHLGKHHTARPSEDELRTWAGIR